MKVICPTCDTALPATQVNVATDVAVCLSCGEAFSLSKVIAAEQESVEVDLSDPPRGAWFEDTGIGWRIGATTRSCAALFLVPFMCVWSGFSLGGIYGSQIAKGELDPTLSLFGVPFILGTLLFGSIALMTVCGKVILSVDGNDAQIFTGVGPFGWRRRFDWASISAVQEECVGYRCAGSHGMVIALVGKSRLTFGSMLTDARRYYLLQALRTLRASRT